LASEAELRQLAVEYAEARQTLERVRAESKQTLDRILTEHASERNRLEAQVTERDAQLQEQAANLRTSQQAARHALSQSEDKLRSTVEAHSREIAQLQSELTSFRQELETTRSQRDVLRSEANRLPELLKQLNESQAENRRQFEHAPYGLIQCGRGGELRHANRALVELLGYRTANELRRVDFATDVFESADDLHWLIERCVSAGTTESVEANWRRKDGGRLVVRLVALAAAPESIEIIANDITTLRALEEKLHQAQRMEAVGRLASEVAVTCDDLLRNVSQDGQQWLATIGNDTHLRNQGEQLLGEVTRAAGFLRQLAVYGKTQASALEPVNVNRVLREFEPVLRRVAGDDIELVLPKSAPTLNVDVDVERVERVLVNVAGYARERMPFGGQLKIDFATAVVDRKFVAEHPNVRPGAHVLITVTEVRGSGQPDWRSALQDQRAGVNKTTSASDGPGVDLGALLRLIGECGGHLWMTAEPPGNMVLKIHLPKRASDGRAEPKQPTRSRRHLSVGRWFGN
jgi:PAS domain S-box-containing protein